MGPFWNLISTCSGIPSKSLFPSAVSCIFTVEALPRYQRNKLRFWSASTMSHNTVVVDRSDQKGGKPVGNLLFFEALPGLSMVQVDSTAFYKHAGVTRYRRTVIHNTVETDRPYFVDVFEVAGGKVHCHQTFGRRGARCSEASMRRSPPR